MRRRRTIDDTFNIWPSFTDAITAIFIFMMFFLIVMMIKNYVDLSRLRALEELVGKVEKDIDELKEFMQGEDVMVEEGTIVMQSDILFPFDKCSIGDIMPTGRRRLRRIGTKLRNFLRSKDSKLFRIVVEGHTDSFGSQEYNQGLSFNRAQTIVTFWDQSGFSPREFDITPVGLGELRLIVPSGTVQKQAPNRRIEIRLMPKFEQLIQSLKERRILTSR